MARKSKKTKRSRSGEQTTLADCEAGDMVWIAGARWVLSIRVGNSYLCRRILSDEEVLPGSMEFLTTRDHVDWPEGTPCTMWLSCRTPRRNDVPNGAAFDPVA